MTRGYVALLRNITNVPMQPYRDALSRLGLSDVASYGGSGNLMFNAPPSDPAEIERQITDAVGAMAFARTREELASVVDSDPHRGQPGAAVLFLPRNAPVAPEAFDRLRFEGPAPVISGTTVYFVHPTRILGRRGNFDFERELGVRGTGRASRVVSRILERMREA